MRIASSALDITPKAVLTWRRDLFENVLGIAVSSAEPATELVITSELEVELYETMPLSFRVEDHALYFPFRYKAEEQTALRPYLDPVYNGHSQIAHWLAPFRQVPKNTETFSVVDRMNRRIHAQFAYEVREAAGVLAPAKTLRAGAGSCRGLAALFLESLKQPSKAIGTCPRLRVIDKSQLDHLQIDACSQMIWVSPDVCRSLAIAPRRKQPSVPTRSRPLTRARSADAR